MRLDGFKVHGAAVLVVLGTGVGYAVAGAGGNEVTLAGPQVLRLIQQAPAALSSYPSVKMTVKMTFSGNGSQSLDVREDALLSGDGKSGSFVVHTPNGAHDIDVIFVGHTMYAPAPTGHYPAVAGKQWLSYTTSLPVTRTVPGDNDAMAFLKLMPGATGPVRIIGHEHIDKARTTHYRVNIDVAKALANAPAELRNNDATAELQRLGITTMPIDIWLDAQNEPRQMTYSLSGEGASFRARMRFAGSRTPLHLNAPDPSVTYDVTDVHQFFQLATGR